MSIPKTPNPTYIYDHEHNEYVDDVDEHQKDEDVINADKKDVSIKKQLFGIGGQYEHMGISLDAKYSGDILYQVLVDNMAPLIPANTDVVLRFCQDFAFGEICIYRYNNENYCHQILKENGKLIAKSFNPKYSPVTLDPQKFFFIGVVYSVHYVLKGK